MTDIQISPRGQAIAEALLHAADKLGYPVDVVRTTARGYIVPEDVADLYGKLLTGEVSEPVETEEIAAAPDDSWKNAAIEAYAGEHGIDLGGATKKADMLAVIAAAGNKEE